MFLVTQQVSKLVHELMLSNCLTNLSIQMGGSDGGHEELRSVGSRAGVSH